MTTPIILTDDYWNQIEVNARAHREHVARSRMEVASFYSLLGQSSREDCARAYADLYGMAPVFDGWSNGYTSFVELQRLLNEVVNLNDGLTEPYRRQVVLETTPVWFLVSQSMPLADVNKRLQFIANLSSLALGIPVPLGVVPPWRIRNGACDVRRWVCKDRPSKVMYVEERVPSPRIMANPNQIEDGFLILQDSPQRTFKQPGVQGLSVLRDGSDRMHLIFWETVRKTARWCPKVPQYVHSFDMACTEQDALQEMRAVAAAMHRAVREEGLLAWQAAAMADIEPDLSVPTVSGGNDWLQAVESQRETNERYRNLGALAD